METDAQPAADPPKDRKTYNGIEHFPNMQMGLAHYRTLDAGIGRWLQVDPKSESFYALTPYNSMGGNPVSMVDPEGDLPFLAEIAGLTNGVRNLLNGDNFFDGFAQGWTQSWEITGGIFQYDSDLSFGQNIWNTVSKLTWELPQTVIGLTVTQGLNVGTVVNDVNYFRGATVLDTEVSGGAFSLGSYISGPAGFRPDFTDHLFVHEFGHYLQSKRVGPLYLNFVLYQVSQV